MIQKLGSNIKKVIVKFCKWKGCGQILRVRNELRKFNMADMDLASGSSIFINQNLWSYHWLLLPTSMKLHSKDQISSWYVFNGSVTIKLQENSAPMYISHI